jgi:RNA polymerase sigma-70 factor (ECF subfamily)
MDENFLAERFEASRKRLSGVALRMLGSRAEAEDAVQETWLRLARSDVSGVENLGGWLTTVVARVCLDMLRSRKSRGEEVFEADGDLADEGDIERDMALADSVGLALLVLLDRLSPAERLAFVLHDMFDLSFDEIAPIIDRSPEAARQLASRARRRVQGADAPSTQTNRRQIIDAFLTAARGGDMTGLLTVLDPDVVFRADAAAMRLGSLAEIRGAAAVAGVFSGRAQAARPAWVDGALDVAVVPGDKLLLVLRIEISAGRIVAVEAVADPGRLEGLDVELI